MINQNSLIQILHKNMKISLKLILFWIRENISQVWRYKLSFEPKDFALANFRESAKYNFLA